VGRVFVRRFTGSAWQQVGPALNESYASEAYDPVLVGIGGVPYVAFREEMAGGQYLFVKRFP